MSPNETKTVNQMIDRSIIYACFISILQMTHTSPLTMFMHKYKSLQHLVDDISDRWLRKEFVSVNKMQTTCNITQYNNKTEQF